MISLVSGFGFGLMFLAGTVAVGRYFYHKRARAMGAALCGAGIGMFIFVPFVRYITEAYTWRGSMFILAGFSLNGCVLSALLRPIEYIADDEEFDVKADVHDNEFDIHSVHEIKGIQSNGKILNSLEDVHDNLSVRSVQSKLTNSHLENNLTNGHCDTHSHNGSIFLSALKIDCKSDHDNENGQISVVVPLMNGTTTQEKEIKLNGHILRSVSPQQPRTFADIRREQLGSFPHKSVLGSQRSLRSVNLSVVSQSIFGSNASFEYMFGKRVRSKLSMKSSQQIQQTTKVPDDTDSMTTQEDVDKFNISIIELVCPKVLVKNINFKLMMLTCLFAGIPSFIPYSMLPDFAQHYGATAAQGAWTLSAIGIGGRYKRFLNIDIKFHFDFYSRFYRRNTMTFPISRIHFYVYLVSLVKPK
mgnify:FL=1